jgi:hypothetical protein
MKNTPLGWSVACVDELDEYRGQREDCFVSRWQTKELRCSWGYALAIDSCFCWCLCVFPIVGVGRGGKGGDEERRRGWWEGTE